MLALIFAALFVLLLVPLPLGSARALLCFKLGGQLFELRDERRRALKVPSACELVNLFPLPVADAHLYDLPTPIGSPLEMKSGLDRSRHFDRRACARHLLDLDRALLQL